MSERDEIVLGIHAGVVRDRLERLGQGPLHTLRGGGLMPTAILESMIEQEGKDTRVFIPRSRIETMREYKQPIAYVVVHRDGFVLSAQRTKKSPEGRLHGKRVIGFGGHIGLSDHVDNFDSLGGAMLTSMYREIREELGMDPRHFGGEVKFHALLNDESDNVGLHHFGLVAFVEADANWPLPPDGELINFAWLDAALLSSMRDVMESWSRILVDDLASADGVLPRAAR